MSCLITDLLQLLESSMSVRGRERTRQERRELRKEGKRWGKLEEEGKVDPYSLGNDSYSVRMMLGFRYLD